MNDQPRESAVEPTHGYDFSELARIVGGLAHEIKNPLSTINLNLRLLSEDLSQYRDEEHRRLQRRLSHVMEEAGRLRETLDDFLRYAGKYELNCRRVDLRELVEELHDFFIAQAESAHVVLRLALTETPAWCMIDENLIKQALLNLLLNAVQAMDDGGELLVRVDASHDQALLEVIDTGPGMDPQQQQRIFEPYFSTKPSGSGLGLPTARRIVQEHGGQMRVESEPGKGTRFTIALPLAETAMADQS